MTTSNSQELSALFICCEWQTFVDYISHNCNKCQLMLLLPNQFNKRTDFWIISITWLLLFPNLIPNSKESFHSRTLPPTHFIKVEGLSFQNFPKKGRRWVSNFFHRKAGVGKIGWIIWKRVVPLIFRLAILFQCYLSLSVTYVCVFSLFTPFLSVLFVFHKKNLTRYMRLNLVFIWNSVLWETFNFCFWTVFCWY